MYVGILEAISEVMFWVTGGVALANSWWVIVWILTSALILAIIPVWTKFYIPIFVIAFFPIVLITVGVLLTQLNMITECRDSNMTIQVDGKDQFLNIVECREKSNYYDVDYGDWNVYIAHDKQ